MINNVVIKREIRDQASPDAMQVDVDGSGLIEFHEFVKFIVSANNKYFWCTKNI